MMQMFFLISGFDSGSLAHYRSDTVQRFIYLIKVEHFVLMESVSSHPLFSVLVYLIGHIFMMQMFFFEIKGFDSGLRSPFRSDILKRFIYLMKIEDFVLMERVTSLP